MTDEEPMFDPEELEEIAQIMDRIMSDEAVGYEMIFWVNESEAKNLVESFERFANGSKEDGVRCMMEFSKIIQQLKSVIEEDEKNV